MADTIDNSNRPLAMPAGAPRSSQLEQQCDELEQLFVETEQDKATLVSHLSHMQKQLKRVHMENALLIDELSQYAASDLESDASDSDSASPPVAAAAAVASEASASRAEASAKPKRRLPPSVTTSGLLAAAAVAAAKTSASPPPKRPKRVTTE